MGNKIFFTPNCIEVQCDRNDVETQTKLVDFYPVHMNRIRTKFKLSIHNTPEILKALRGIDESNIDTAPLAIQNYFYKEIRLRENMADLLKNEIGRAHV